MPRARASRTHAGFAWIAFRSADAVPLALQVTSRVKLSMNAREHLY